jgi:hypothetical protein
MTGGAKEIPMSHDVYYQFIAIPGQARRAGARGGKTTARNRRQRRDGVAAEVPQPEQETAPPVPLETTAAAIALLDAQYPWLRGAEQRFWNRPQGARGEGVLPC